MSSISEKFSFRLMLNTQWNRVNFIEFWDFLPCLLNSTLEDRIEITTVTYKEKR